MTRRLPVGAVLAGGRTSKHRGPARAWCIHGQEGQFRQCTVKGGKARREVTQERRDHTGPSEPRAAPVLSWRPGDTTECSQHRSSRCKGWQRHTGQRKAFRNSPGK